jgi:ribosomal protein L44E
VSVTVWCPKCAKFTTHRVDQGLRGPCLDCLARPVQAEKVKPAEMQGELF